MTTLDAIDASGASAAPAQSAASAASAALDRAASPLPDLGRMSATITSEAESARAAAEA